MTQNAIQRRIVAELRKKADQDAMANGIHRSRSIEELRYYAGYVMGMRDAADCIEQLTREDHDGFDD